MIPITLATTTTTTTYTYAGLANIVKRVQLNISDGTSNRMQTDATGWGLIRRAARVLSGLDINTLGCIGVSLNARETASANSTSGKTYYLTIPLLFKHPQISDPVGSIFMLPLPRYNTNPVLTVFFDAATAVASAQGTGFGITIGSPYIVQVQRQVNNITFPTVETEVRELTQTQSSTGNNQIFNLDIPGSYSAIDIYTVNSSGVPTDISPGPAANGFWTLQFLGQQIRQFNLFDVKTQEQYSMGNDMYFQNQGGANALVDVDYFPGLFHLDFLHDQYGMEVAELGSLLNVNVLAGSGAQLQLNMNIGSTGTVSVVAERFFGDLSGYGLTYNPSGN